MQPQATQNLTTVTGFKARNPEVDVTPWGDATISGFISTATRSIQNYCQVDGFLTTTVTSERGKAVISTPGDLFIYPRIRPIQSVSAIRLVKGGFSTNLTISGSTGLYYQIPYPYTYLDYPSSYLAGVGTLSIGGSQQLVTLRGAGTYYELDYTGGFVTIPEDLTDACDLWVRDLVTRRLNPTGAQLVRQGSFMLQRSMRNDTVDSIYISQAKEILNAGGYVRTAQG